MKGLVCMEQRSLKVLATDKTFFAKVTNTLTKLLIPTKVVINGIMITIKRNNLLKTYENYINNPESKGLLNRYEESFSLYLETIDKHIMDSIYKKVKNGTASDFEKDALSQYYTITSLKEKDYLEYKYRKQKYLLELDYETLISSGKEKLVQKYQPFYVEKMDGLYKGILKSYSIKLTDTISQKRQNNNGIYNQIFETIEEYVTNILPIKVETDNTEMKNILIEENEKFTQYTVGKFDTADIIEKNMVLLGMSRKLFTHSLPLGAAAECYIALIKEARELAVKTKNEKKQKNVFELLMNLIEEYNIKLLSTKVFWEKSQEKEEYKEFWNQYKSIKSKQEKEILFIKYDLKMLNRSKKDYKEIKKLYKQKLVEYGVMRNLKNTCKTIAGAHKRKIKV